MKKIAVLILLLWLLAGLCLSAGATGLTSHSQLRTDGSCLVNLSFTPELTGEDTSVLLRLPPQATDISVKGDLEYERSADGLRIYVSGNGSRTLSIQYLLDGLLNKTKTGTWLTLPILPAQGFPIARLEFSVTFPKELDAQPTFESSWHAENFADAWWYSFDGTTLTGGNKQTLRDQETLDMTVQVPNHYFHDAPRHFNPLDKWDLVIALLVFFSALYFVLTLMPKFPGRARRSTPPDDIHAGDVGTCLTGCGTDLTMLVLSWAQLGYILIELDHHNRVTLHKRMDMGNERSSHEIRWFNSLFGQRTMIDADSYHYAKLCRKLAAKSPLIKELYHKKSGNPAIFRILCCITGIIAGLQMALGLGVNAGVKTLLAMVFACLCGLFSFFIQSGGKCLPLREKRPLWIGLGCSIAWIVLGALAGDLQQAVPMVIFQFIAGIAAAYGGKRSETGLMYLRQIRGLRRHMQHASSFDLQQLLQKNPYYFYEMAPYALTLGVDRSFARRFGKIPLPEDSYLVCGNAHTITAAQFAARLRRVADVLNYRQKRLPYEQFKRK